MTVFVKQKNSDSSVSLFQKNNLDGWELPKNIEVVGVSSVKEAIYKAFGKEN